MSFEDFELILRMWTEKKRGLGYEDRKTIAPNPSPLYMFFLSALRGVDLTKKKG
jgi:hypothetical protein